MPLSCGTCTKVNKCDGKPDSQPYCDFYEREKDAVTHPISYKIGRFVGHLLIYLATILVLILVVGLCYKLIRYFFL